METEILQSLVTSCRSRSGFQNNSKLQRPERGECRSSGNEMGLGARRELEQELEASAELSPLPAPRSPSVCSGGTGSGEPAATETEVIVEPGSIRKEIPEGVLLIDTYNEVTVPQNPLLQEGKCWMLPEAEPRSEQQQSSDPEEINLH